MRERTREQVSFESIPENSESELMWRRAADCSRDSFRPPEMHGRQLQWVAYVGSVTILMMNEDVGGYSWRHAGNDQRDSSTCVVCARWPHAQPPPPVLQWCCCHLQLCSIGRPREGMASFSRGVPVPSPALITCPFALWSWWYGTTALSLDERRDALNHYVTSP